MFVDVVIFVIGLLLGGVAGVLVGRNNRDEVEAVVKDYEELIEALDRKFDSTVDMFENEVSRLQGRVEAAENKTAPKAKKAASSK